MLSLRFDNSRKFSNVICYCYRNICFSRCLLLTHYEVLNLKPSCTQKEVRDSYLKLCKENHPDRDKNDESLHNKFQRINEAYNVLSKPQTRKKYDASIAYLDENKRIRSVLYRDHYYNTEYRRMYNDPSFYHNRKGEFMNADEVDDNRYYGIKGIKRLSNGTLFLILLGFSFFCGMVQIITIKNSLMTQERLRISKENAAILQKLREKAASRTEEENLAEIEKTHNENLEKIDINYKNN
ncbi:uncharacterized protein LOC142331453 [Lycorma delicatula]|uniref:uncharacterized protein LOC142331453 n=1 Tax=Lycorma delicatula TaxID=130591 RepID=UPI003F50DA12